MKRNLSVVLKGIIKLTKRHYLVNIEFSIRQGTISGK